jgi:plastocyanin
MIRQAVVTVLLLAMAALPARAGSETVVVSIKEFKFNPPEITVPVGATVRWENDEKRQYHSVWFEAQGDPEPDYFFPGESYERTFDRVGAFPYRCGPHPEMTGVVRVVRVVE